MCVYTQQRDRLRHKEPTSTKNQLLQRTNFYKEPTSTKNQLLQRTNFYKETTSRPHRKPHTLTQQGSSPREGSSSVGPREYQCARKLEASGQEGHGLLALAPVSEHPHAYILYIIIILHTHTHTHTHTHSHLDEELHSEGLQFQMTLSPSTLSKAADVSLQRRENSSPRVIFSIIVEAALLSPKTCRSIYMFMECPKLCL